MTDDDANKFIEEYGEKYKWISAVRNYRRINSLKRKLESFDNATMSDGRYYGSLMYMGAHTGRWSGSGANLNLQNLPRGEMFGVNLRNLISPKKGNSLIVADLSQIEVRTLCWLARDVAMLKEIAKTEDIYEAFARRLRLFRGDGDFKKKQEGKLRHTVKQIVLGCGYGASAAKFSLITGMPLEQAESSVYRYRNMMKKVPAYWNELQRKMHIAYSRREDFILDLPSGRSLNYGKISTTLKDGRRTYVAKITKGSKNIPVRLWGGLLAENISQALARDVFADQLIRLAEQDMNILFHVHDEFIIETKEEEANQTLEKVIQVMSEAPKWISDIPLSADGKVVSRYEK
jgi:DNA polymerase